MTHIHYKFSSKLSYNTVVFDGPHITLIDLKRQIMGKEKLRAGDCDLQITNAQTKEEYTTDEDLIPKGSSVIVRRIPIIGAKSSSSGKTHNSERSDGQVHHSFGASRAMDSRSSAKALSFFSKIQMANLADADVSEEDKIRVMMNQSTYDPMNMNTKIGTVLPDNYTCYRCGNGGHHIRNCPVSVEKNFDGPPRIKKSTGIPRSFMVEVDDPSIKGVMLTNCGRYAIPAIDAEAYAIGKKERPPFIPQERPKSEGDDDPIPDELLCLICHDLLGDAVVIPCCGNSYCDDCIRTALLDSEDHVCPTCGQSDVSPDTLIANKFLRQAINNFKKEQGQMKNLKRRTGTLQSQNETPTQSPAPTPTPTPPQPSMQSHMQKPLQSVYNQQAAKTASLSQGPDFSLVATEPASADSQSVTSNNEAEGKTDGDSAAAAPSVLGANKDPPSAPSQLIPVVNHAQREELPQTLSENQKHFSSDSTLKLPESSAPWESSSSAGCPTGGLTESTTPQPLASSSSSLSSYSATPSPLFPSPFFHTLIPTHQPNNSYSPGYPAMTPNWMHNPQGGPIPSLCSSTSTSSIPVLMPKEWHRPQIKKKESSLHRHSSSHSKSKSSRSYSRSSSRSGSRSRSRSRSRPFYSSHRQVSSRSHNPSCSYGYKRPPSTTPSSSSSPQGGYHSRSKSSADNWKSRHPSRKSAPSSHSSRTRREHLSGKETGSSSNAQCSSSVSSLELDRQRYLQWKKEYHEWYEKYYSSYISQFQHMHLPPPPYPEDLFNPKQGSATLDISSLSSDSPVYSRSSPTESSSDGHSTPSHPSSDSSSSSSYKPYDGHYPPSHSSSHGGAMLPEDGAQPREFPGKSVARYSCLPATQSRRDEELNPKEEKVDKKQLILKSTDELGSLELQGKKRMELDGGADNSQSTESADTINVSSANRKEPNSEPSVCKHDTAVRHKASVSAARQSAPPLLKPDKPLEKDLKRKSEVEMDLEKEQEWKKGKDSGSKEEVDRRRKIKPSKQPDKLDSHKGEQPGGSRAPDSRSDKNRKRKGEDSRRSERESNLTVKPQSSKCPKTESSEQPQRRESESLKPLDRKKLKTEKKEERRTWPEGDQVGDIWEGGIKVIPQKRISININLDVKRNDKTDLQHSSDLQTCTQEIKQESDIGEEKLTESTSEIQMEEKNAPNQENMSEDRIKADDKEERQLCSKAALEDAGGDLGKRVAREEEQDGMSKDEGMEELDLWHCALKAGEEEEDSIARKEGPAEEMEELKANGKNHEMAELVQTSTNKKDENEVSCRDETSEPQREEHGTGRSSSQRSRDPHDGRQTPGDGSIQMVDSEEIQRRTTAGTALQEAAEGSENKLIVMQMLCSKSENNEEERDQGNTRVDTDTLALSHPSVMQTGRGAAGENQQQGHRSMEEEAERDRGMARGRDEERGRRSSSSRSLSSGAPSGGRDRTDRDRETRTGRDRGRRGESERQRETKRSTQGRRDEERRGDWERSKTASVQKKELPSSSHSSSSQDTERPGWQPRGSRSSSQSLWKSSRGGSEINRSSNWADQNPPSTLRDLSQDSKSKEKDLLSHCGNHQGYREKDRPAQTPYKPPSLFHNHGQDRSPLPFGPSGGPQWGGAPDWGLMRGKSQDENRAGKGKWELEKVLKAEKEGEEERHNPEASASHEKSKDDKREEEKEKKHKKEKRQATPELQEGDQRRQKKWESSRD
ncbi:unnamed protein product [Menidia menidia]|uniref:(Atlantic silverside) hypothetical protein n=2 Tax=Menidia menidia TaxID=238744 RepID=A0A8S4ARF4_9TELE|nr:unnamed protein product [Menidia menidia]